MGKLRFDDEVDAALRSRGWHSRRAHGEQNGYKPGFDSWGWGGDAPGGIDIRCIGSERYEASWVRASTKEAVLETLESRDEVLQRAVALERMTDFIPT